MTDKCIGECIKPNEKTIHPLTFEIMGNFDQDISLCPSEPYIMYSRNNKIITKEEKNIKCDKNNEISLKEVDNMIYNPEVKFNMDSFLEMYNITSFDAGILWIRINKDQKPFNTIYRLLNVIWQVYHNKIKKISIEIIDCYKSIIHKLLEDDQDKYNLLKKNKNMDKIIKKAIKKILKHTQDWDNFDFDINKKIKNNIIKYTK